MDVFRSDVFDIGGSEGAPGMRGSHLGLFSLIFMHFLEPKVEHLNLYACKVFIKWPSKIVCLKDMFKIILQSSDTNQ